MNFAISSGEEWHRNRTGPAPPPSTKTDGSLFPSSAPALDRHARQDPPALTCHTFPASGITAYLANGGQLEHAYGSAAHESPRTTMLYDRTGDHISRDEIQRIAIKTALLPCPSSRNAGSLLREYSLIMSS